MFALAATLARLTQSPHKLQPDLWLGPAPNTNWGVALPPRQSEAWAKNARSER